MKFKCTSPSVSMEQSLSKITAVFQLSGIQHFNISPETFDALRSNSLTRKFKMIFLANITLVIVEFSAIILAIYMDGQPNEKRGNAAMGQIIQDVSYIVMVIVLLTTILNSFFLRGTAKQIFKNLKVISKTLLTLRQSIDYAAFENETRKLFAIIAATFVGLTLATNIFILHHNHTNVFFWAMLAIYPYFFIVIAFGYWTLLVRLIRENLRFVKECLVQLQIEMKMFRGRGNSGTVNERNVKLNNDLETYNVIMKLKRIYGIIYETTALINELIAVPVCLIITYLIIGNVSSGYKVFLSFRNDIPLERVAGKKQIG